MSRELDTGAIAAWERRGLEGWPAHESLEQEGWLLRFAGGYTRRSNAVYPFDWAGGDADQAIARCESEYRARGLRPVFKLTDASQPADLDERLAAHGYLLADPTSLRRLALADASCSAREGVRVEPGVDPKWLDACVRLNALPPPAAELLSGVVQRMREPLAASLEVQGETAAQCLGVVVGDQLSICLMATAPAHRRGGLGRRVLSALLAHARQRGLLTAWLAVECDNAPALALYEQLGFAELYRYWYRQLEA